MDADQRRFIIDTDWGIDDVQCIFLALKYLNVVGITTVAGNVEVDKIVKNVSKILEVSDIKIPIYRGAEEPMIRDLVTAEFFHGVDGMGDSVEIAKMEGYMDWLDTSLHAAEFIVQEAKNPGLNLICIGPLTNIALAMILDPELPSKIDNIYMMGGTLFGKGNCKVNGEYNFTIDPEATYKVISQFRNMHIIPWEACIDFVVPEELWKKFFTEEHPKLKFFGETHKPNYVRNSRVEFCDGLVAMIIINPSLCTEYYELQAIAFTQGDAAGQVSYAWPKYTFLFDESKINWKVYHKFKVEESVQLMLDALSN